MKKILIALILLGLAAAFLWWPLPAPRLEKATRLARASLTLDVTPATLQSTTSRGLLLWLGIRGPARVTRPEIGTAFLNIVSTGFASSPYQTDATPCRTASGVLVRPGTVASNFLPLGTLLEITVDGEKIPGTFIVEDRMADRFNSRIDIWFAQTSQALDFGKRRVEITVVGYGKPGQPLGEAESVEVAGGIPGESLWETIKLRALSLTDFLATRGTGVNRFDVDCLELQQAELGLE